MHCKVSKCPLNVGQVQYFKILKLCIYNLWLKACVRPYLHNITRHCFTDKSKLKRLHTGTHTNAYNKLHRDINVCSGVCGHFFFLWLCDPTRVMASSFLRFLDHTQRRITVSRTPLDKWSTRRRDLYLTTHNTHNRQTSMPPVRFESTISASERPQTYALDRAAAGTGKSSP